MQALSAAGSDEFATVVVESCCLGLLLHPLRRSIRLRILVGVHQEDRGLVYEIVNWVLVTCTSSVRGP